MKAELRRTVFVEVTVAALVVLFIEPILKLFWDGIIWQSNNIYTGTINSIYKSVAMGKRNHVDVIFF